MKRETGAKSIDLIVKSNMFCFLTVHHHIQARQLQRNLLPVNLAQNIMSGNVVESMKVREFCATGPEVTVATVSLCSS